MNKQLVSGLQAYRSADNYISNGNVRLSDLPMSFFLEIHTRDGRS